MREPTLADVSGVIGLIYQAAYDPAQWGLAIQAMRELFDGSAACFTHHSTDKMANWAYSANPDAGYFRKYVEEYTDANPLLECLSAAPLNKVVGDAGLFDVTEFRRSGFWNEWMKPQDMYAGLCCKIHQTQDSILFVDVRRGSSQSDFGRKEAELLSLLVPHFERASQINQQMRVADALTRTFSRLPFGAILVSSDLRILQSNDLAETWMDSNEIELKRFNGFLTARSPILNQLQQLVVDACGLHRDGVTGRGGHLLLESDTEAYHSDIEPHHVVDYAIEVAPLFDSPFDGLPGGHCAILIIKKIHMGNLEGFDEYVRTIFRLTRSEARLADHLAAGFSLKEAAVHVGVKNSTTRTYLEHLFRKTGTHQQSQLVALLKNAAPALMKIAS